MSSTPQLLVTIPMTLLIPSRYETLSNPNDVGGLLLLVSTLSNVPLFSTLSIVLPTQALKWWSAEGSDLTR